MIKVGDVNAHNTGVADQTNLVLSQSVAGTPREVHPIGSYRIEAATFTTTLSLGVLPYSILTGDSEMLASVVSGNRLTSRINTVPTTSYRFAERKYDGSCLTIETILTDIKPLSQPSCLILCSDAAANKRVEVIFGSDGSKIRAMTGTVVDYEVPFTHALTNNDKLTVRRIRSLVMVYVNDVFVYSGQNALFTNLGGKTFVGVSTWASPGLTSTSFKNIYIDGSTTQPATVLARLDIERSTIGSFIRTNVGTLYVAAGGPAVVQLAGASWVNGTTFSTRKFYAYVNGVEKVVIETQNGGTASATVTLDPYSMVEIFAYSDAGTADRAIKGGRLEIFPA